MWSITLYINNKAHLISHLGGSFFADCEGHPRVPCSEHRIGLTAAQGIADGMTVRTLGNRYSLKPDADSHP